MFGHIMSKDRHCIASRDHVEHSGLPVCVHSLPVCHNVVFTAVTLHFMDLCCPSLLTRLFMFHHTDWFYSYTNILLIRYITRMFTPSVVWEQFKHILSIRKFSYGSGTVSKKNGNVKVKKEEDKGKKIILSAQHGLYLNKPFMIDNSSAL